MSDSVRIQGAEGVRPQSPDHPPAARSPPPRSALASALGTAGAVQAAERMGNVDEHDVVIETTRSGPRDRPVSVLLRGRRPPSISAFNAKPGDAGGKGTTTMKGRIRFTGHEVEQIREFLRMKLRTPSEDQKQIRDRLRDIGFYISDFPGTRRPFGSDDLDGLIRERRITVVGR